MTEKSVSTNGFTRRELLSRSGLGLGALGLANILREDDLCASQNRVASLSGPLNNRNHISLVEPNVSSISF